MQESIDQQQAEKCNLLRLEIMKVWPPEKQLHLRGFHVSLLWPRCSQSNVSMQLSESWAVSSAHTFTDEYLRRQCNGECICVCQLMSYGMSWKRRICNCYCLPQIALPHHIQHSIHEEMLHCDGCGMQQVPICQSSVMSAGSQKTGRMVLSAALV